MEQRKDAKKEGGGGKRQNPAVVGMENVKESLGE